jgi:hypothetical protein
MVSQQKIVLFLLMVFNFLFAIKKTKKDSADVYQNIQTYSKKINLQILHRVILSPIIQELKNRW